MTSCCSMNPHHLFSWHNPGTCRCLDCTCIQPQPNEPTWSTCAMRDDTCACEGVVRFGSNERGWLHNIVDGAVNCSNKFLRGGDQPEECQCKPQFPSGQLEQRPVGWPDDQPAPRLLIMTVSCTTLFVCQTCTE